MGEYFITLLLTQFNLIEGLKWHIFIFKCLLNSLFSLVKLQERCWEQKMLH